MTDDGKPECLVLKPRFVNRDGSSYFDGYEQIIGNVTLDTHGYLYGVVRSEDYNLLKTRIEKLEGALKSLADETQGFLAQANPADHGHTNISVMRHWIEVAREALKP